MQITPHSLFLVSEYLRHYVWMWTTWHIRMQRYESF